MVHPRPQKCNYFQKESIRRRGQTLQLIIAGQRIGFHVVQEAITNGVIPFVLTNNLPEENAMMLVSRTIAVYNTFAG